MKTRETFVAVVGFLAVFASAESARAQNVRSLGVTAALQSAAFDPVALPAVRTPLFSSFTAERLAARAAYLDRRDARRRDVRRRRQARFESTLRPTFNPGFHLPPQLGHYGTRFGLATGPQFRF